MGQATLTTMMDSWLDAPMVRLGLLFPPELEARFESDTGAARSRALMGLGGLGFLLGALLYATALPIFAWPLGLFLPVPIGLLVAAGLRLDPPAPVREGAMLLASMSCVAAFSWLDAGSATVGAVFIMSGANLLLAYVTLGLHLRFRFAAVAVVAVILGCGLAMDSHPEIGRGLRRNLLVLATATASCLLLANWRLELHARRSYLLGLRETLRRQDMSVRSLEPDVAARRDMLTGLANRLAYDAWLEAAWEQGSALRDRVGLIIIDVDRFRAFNDFYGRVAGDQCLQKIALCLREQLRGTTDLVARLNGEAFGVLLPGLQEDVCADVAERMRAAVQRLELPHLGLGPRGLVTLSAGVASHLAGPGLAPADLRDAAASALHQAKVSGRNRICVGTIHDPAGVETSAVE